MITHPNIPQVALGSDIPRQAREWRNSYGVRKWCRQHTLITEDEHLDWLGKIHEDPTIKMFGIVVEGQPVGVCGLTSIDRINQKAEFSMYIAPNFQRRGFGGSALLLLLMQGFQAQNLNRIWGEGFDGNLAQYLFKQIGMKLEGTQKQAYFREGRFIDSHIWAITRGEFNAIYSNRLSHSDERASGGVQSVPVSGKSNDIGEAAEYSPASWIHNADSPLTYEKVGDVSRLLEAAKSEFRK